MLTAKINHFWESLDSLNFNTTVIVAQPFEMGRLCETAVNAYITYGSYQMTIVSSNFESYADACDAIEENIVALNANGNLNLSENDLNSLSEFLVKELFKCYRAVVRYSFDIDLS